MEARDAIVDAILIADDQDTFVTRRIKEVNLEFGGIRGDRHFGLTRPADSRQPMYERGAEIWNRRQITILSSEECANIAEKLGIEAILPEWLGANLLLKGYPELSRLPMGSRILLPDGGGLICMGENKPCTLPGAVVQKHHDRHPNLTKEFVRAASRKRGIVCAVERPGTLWSGDRVKVLVNDFTDPMQ